LIPLFEFKKFALPAAAVPATNAPIENNEDCLTNALLSIILLFILL
jgi:hypothetical protein